MTVGFLINSFVFAMLFAFGSFLNYILDKYNATTSTAAAVQSIFIGFGLSSGIFSGTLIARYGLWKVSIVGAFLVSTGFIISFLATSIVPLFVCISVLSGFGVSILFIAGTTSVGKIFSGHNKLLFMVIQNTGASVGVAVLPYLFEVLVRTYGLNGTFLLIGGFYLNFIPLSMLFSRIEEVPLITTETLQKDIHICGKYQCLFVIREELSLLGRKVKVVLTVPFTLTAIGIGLVVGSLNGYFAVILDILKLRGLTSQQALLAFPITYGIGFFARILPGVVMQLKGVSCLVVPVILSGCGMVGQILMINSTEVWVILFGCGLSGLTISGVASGANIIAAQLVSSELVSVGIGLEQSCMGIVAAITAPGFGAIRDVLGSYDVVQYMTASFQVVGIVLFVTTSFIRKKTPRKTENLNDGVDNCGFSVET